MAQLDEKAINHEDLTAYHDQLMKSVIEPLGLSVVNGQICQTYTV